MPGGDPIDFSSWRAAFRRAVEHGEATDVPCAGCTACCRSYQFVHVEPDERATLGRIPAALLVPAPGRPEGHMVMGYDSEGRCPMLTPDGCGIYEHRPRTCRTYDCRVFAATGVRPEQPLVADRVALWRFDGEEDRLGLIDRARRLRSAGMGPASAAVRAVMTEVPTLPS